MVESGSGKIKTDTFRHVALGDTVSTNSECIMRARAGDPGHLWVTAARQTGGRGRRGRTWVSEPGNLYASLLLIDPAPLSQRATLPLAVALAVRSAICEVLPAPETVKLKWPNDVLIRGKKTSGILLESEDLPDGRNALVIGCGINIQSRPENTLYPSTCLAMEGASVSPDALFAHLLRSMAEVLSTWDQGRGIARITQLWRDAAIGLGEKITVNFTDHSISGIFSGIDDKGYLLLETGAGQPQAVAAGDVFFD
jgi:BirA family biotin operon repressor/biotin-[acetyl-CoA-carboxylase] ligase